MCRFCQHSFVEEEAAERLRFEAEKSRLEVENAERLATAARLQAEWAAQAAKPWVRRNGGALIILALILCAFGGTIWYRMKHPIQPSQQAATAKNKPTVPTWVAEERSKVPKSVWDKKVVWAIQHDCNFFGMSRDEIVQALGQPTEEQSYDLTYRRQTRDCARYDGDNCAEYKTEQNIIFLQDGVHRPEAESQYGWVPHIIW